MCVYVSSKTLSLCAVAAGAVNEQASPPSAWSLCSQSFSRRGDREHRAEARHTANPSTTKLWHRAEREKTRRCHLERSHWATRI